MTDPTPRGAENFSPDRPARPASLGSPRSENLECPCGAPLVKPARGRPPTYCAGCRRDRAKAYDRERSRRRYADPATRERILARQRAQKRARYWADPEHREAKLDAARQRREAANEG